MDQNISNNTFKCMLQFDIVLRSTLLLEGISTLIFALLTSTLNAICCICLIKYCKAMPNAIRYSTDFKSAVVKLFNKRGSKFFNRILCLFFGIMIDEQSGALVDPRKNETKLITVSSQTIAMNRILDGTSRSVRIVILASRLDLPSELTASTSSSNVLFLIISKFLNCQRLFFSQFDVSN
uniref:Uncharacterized protein n=1 Tax=Romanomermis culicivorax TaxID=13658 RepID=A0A915I1H5_ROMCU